MQNFNKFYKKYVDFSHGLKRKNSYIQERILTILFYTQKHLSAGDIRDEFYKTYSFKISMPTIYSLLKFLTQSGLVNSIKDGDTYKYELNLCAHHDHLICEKCGLIVPFVDIDIENLQEKVALKFDFTLISHSMILYGFCKNCIKSLEK